MLRLLIVLGFAGCLIQHAYSHGGRLNSEGCHNQKGAEYHCHQLSEPATNEILLNKRQPNQSQAKYDRDDYGGWIDADNDCLNTRAEILSITSQEKVTLNTTCTVISGLWFDPFSNQTYTLASDLDIDHIVPLKWAHERGAYAWPDQLKVQFANDPLNLKPVLDRLNQAKGAKPPSEWMPPNQRYRCQYLVEWQAILDKYQLTMIASEQRVFKRMVDACNI